MLPADGRCHSTRGVSQLHWRATLGHLVLRRVPRPCRVEVFPEEEQKDPMKEKPPEAGEGTIGSIGITQLIPREFSGVTAVKFIMPMNSLRIFGVIGGVLLS